MCPSVFKSTPNNVATLTITIIITMTIKNITSDKRYLSDFLNELPSNCIFNKGVTGCGGTHVELYSKRNSIILVPTIELAKNKHKDGFLIVYGGVSENEIETYLNSQVAYKKIIGTYDSLVKIMKFDILDYFLLIDEYHILFNQYTLRKNAIVYLLNNYAKFKNFCFMTATPLDEDTILDEIKHLDRLNLTWTNATPIKLTLVDTVFTNKELINKIVSDNKCNYHIFLNSLYTIKNIVKKLQLTDYRVICSDNNKKMKLDGELLNFKTTRDPINKVNFYTSSCFEGTDLYDPIGKTIILCDTNISTTVLDISTLIRQICGRLRDSVYKDDITLILNTCKHRYAKISKSEFENQVKENIRKGKAGYDAFINGNQDYRDYALSTFTNEVQFSCYLNKFESEIYYDDNLRKLDEHNYKLVTEIYNDSISVLNECIKNDFVADLSISEITIQSEIKSLVNNREFTYKELKDLFTPIFKKYNLVFDKRLISTYFPEFKKIRKTKNKLKETYYIFI